MARCMLPARGLHPPVSIFPGFAGKPCGSMSVPRLHCSPFGVSPVGGGDRIGFPVPCWRVNNSKSVESRASA